MAKKKGFNRRDFLKIIGAGSGMAVSGCSTELPEKLIPYVVQPDDIVPGVATWYTGTCDQCESGCGVLVKTREGRVIKVEGNSSHPINKGGLCAKGHASLQATYSPDRVREPLIKQKDGGFKTVTWKEAVDFVVGKIKERSAGSQVVLATKPVSASVASLVDDFLAGVKDSRHAEHDSFDIAANKLATRKVFGEGVEVGYDFSKADLLVSFSADYLGTWISPVENAKGWSSLRDPEHGHLNGSIHFEPRLSLTAANADQWIRTAPGKDKNILLALLKAVVAAGKSENAAIKSLADSLDSDSLLAGTAVSQSKIDQLAKKLVSAKSSLVVAAGDADTVATSMLINVALGNVGSSLLPRVEPRKPAADTLYGVINELAGGESKVDMLMLSSLNPAYSLPENTKVRKALAKVPTIVCFANELDETTSLAHVIFPVSSSMEAWMDSEPRKGVLNLNQPAMQPVFQTQGFADTLLSISGSLGVKFDDGVKSFYDYMKGKWQAVLGKDDFENKWLEAVEKGGVFKESPAITDWKLAAEATKISPSTDKNVLSVISFPTVLSADGSEANRPWLQEIPDPLTTTVWGSWIEIHPDTAARYGVSKGDVISVVTKNGNVEAPAFLTKNIHHTALALPMGKGHERFGRYGTGIGANAMKTLSLSDAQGNQSLIAAATKVVKTKYKDDMIVTQGSDSQLGRDILQTTTLSAFAGGGAHAASHGKDAHGGGHGGGHGGHHAPKQMYHQMKHTTYRWGMSIDLTNCTGCSACVVSCYAENNIAVVGKELCAQGREMSWLKMDRYMDGGDDHPVEGFQPMLCQHCANAPCEPVCPVYGTYHNEEGINMMVYNRCVGTRYCSNNCSYKVRRFNWFKYDWPEPLTWQLNPDVTVREVGIMEKCNFCWQRVREAKNTAKNEGRMVKDGDIETACSASCPTGAIKFGNLLDENSAVAKESAKDRAYKLLDHHLNTQPGVSYLAKVKNDKVKLS